MGIAAFIAYPIAGSLSRSRLGAARKCVRPASLTMLPIVIALTGLCRGIVTIRIPSVITMCLPSRATRNPAFSGTVRRSLPRSLPRRPCTSSSVSWRSLAQPSRFDGDFQRRGNRSEFYTSRGLGNMTISSTLRCAKSAEIAANDLFEDRTTSTLRGSVTIIDDRPRS